MAASKMGGTSAMDSQLPALARLKLRGDAVERDHLIHKGSTVTQTGTPRLTLSQTRDVAAAAASALLYGATAIAMNFVNKATLTKLGSGMANSVMLLQMVAAIGILLPLKAARLISFPPFSRVKAWQLAPVTVLYTANVGFALVGLSNLNIPMYNALKRLTPVLVLAAKAVMTRKAPPRDITASVVLVVTGCLTASLGDLAFDLKGYTCALLSCGLQTSYLLLVERTGAEKGVGTAELLFYNAVLSLPFLLLVVLCTGELFYAGPALLRACQVHGVLTFPLLLASCSLMGVLLNYAMFLCTMHNSALTTTLVGVFKGVLATVLGFFLLGGVEVHVLNVTGITVNMAGGTWYSIIKYRQKAVAPAAAAGMPVAHRRTHSPVEQQQHGSNLAAATSDDAKGGIQRQDSFKCVHEARRPASQHALGNGSLSPRSDYSPWAAAGERRR